MAFNGNESSPITLADATAWTENYRNANPGQVQAHFFGVNKINEILNQPGCVGIRAYYAIDNTGAKKLVFVGAKSDENDMTDGVILDRSVDCPANCDNNSPLM